MALTCRETERTEPPAVSMARPSRHAPGHDHLLVTTGTVCARTRTRAHVRARNTTKGCRGSVPRPRACSTGRAPSGRTTPPQSSPAASRCRERTAACAGRSASRSARATSAWLEPPAPPRNLASLAVPRSARVVPPAQAAPRARVALLS
ncbi:hypothetical protein SETIT_1G239900v2 [Setaria italica]|uniref:Uncharacterized protein n=1 Tax=Setaria italica TaxID=4555 RepID=A0A368PP35_SETIT|nr:hypothetical protein SETIT_1G239900v2 [Setaria italica]